MNKGFKTLRKTILIAVITLFCVLTITLDIILPLYDFNFYWRTSLKIVQQFCGAMVGILLLLHLRIKLFKGAQNLLYLIPCLIIAVDNFQFAAFFSGKMQLIRKDAIDFILFFLSCMSIGLFEEVVFRGLIFSILAGRFSNNRKGFLTTYVVSSLLFGLAHLFNGFSFGTLLQIGYTVLTGGLFAFCLIKTKNIFCCAFVHGIYNFCGLLFDTQGLGSGVVFDVGTVLTMLIVSIVVGAFVLYKVWTYSEEERQELYSRLSV